MDIINRKREITTAKQCAKFIVMAVCAVLVGCGDSGGDDSDAPPAGADSAAGVATLSWVAPSTRVDDTVLPMSEIGGYKVYMGTSADELVLYQDISDPYQMELVVDDLTTGTYYFAVTAYNQYGAESDFSVIASKSI